MLSWLPFLGRYTEFDLALESYFRRNSLLHLERERNMMAQTVPCYIDEFEVKSVVRPGYILTVKFLVLFEEGGGVQ